MKLIEVIWRDSNFYPVQHSAGDKFQVAKVSTVGYLLSEDADNVTLAMEQIEDGDFEDVRRIAIIPRENVITVSELRKK